MLLTDSKFIKKLEMLSMLARKVLNGELKADRKSQKKGSGTTFADYQEYFPGDDYRNIDWNIAGRLGQLVIKLFELEEDLQLHIFIDISHSMTTKLPLAKELTAALAYIALHNNDRITIYGLSEKLETLLKPSHGKGKIFPMLDTLQKQKAADGINKFSDCIKHFQTRRPKKGLCVVLSDFLIEDDYSAGLDMLRWAGHDVFAIQILDKEELDCSIKGEFELQCNETQRKRRVTISKDMLERYRALLQEWNETLQQNCVSREIGLVQTNSDESFEYIIQNILRKGGLVA